MLVGRLDGKITATLRAAPPDENIEIPLLLRSGHCPSLVPITIGLLPASTGVDAASIGVEPASVTALASTLVASAPDAPSGIAASELELDGGRD